MTTTVQLLANYYKSVIESERIYNQNVIRKPTNYGVHKEELSDPSPRMVQEMLLLQRRIGQLTMEIQVLRKENDTLKELQKTQKALMESKLNNSKKMIEKLKRVGDNTREIDSGEKSSARDRINFHLLSPLNIRSIDGAKQNHYVNLPNKPTGLRHVITNGQQTLFDGDDSRDNLSGDHLDDLAFINSLKNREELAKIVLPNDGLSEYDDSEDRSTSKSSQNGSGKVLKRRRRRLTRKRIKTGDSESDSEDVIKQAVLHGDS